MPKQSDDLSRKGERSQTTKKAKLKIPVPKREEVFDLLERAAKKRPDEEQPQSPPDS
jgi:hypothetical protein